MLTKEVMLLLGKKENKNDVLYNAAIYYFVLLQNIAQPVLKYYSGKEKGNYFLRLMF